jgi:uncharacterized protein YkwD
MYSMILALSLGPAPDVPDNRFRAGGRSVVVQQAAGCAGRSAPPVTFTVPTPPPVTYAVPVPSGGCQGRSVERVRVREVYRERFRTRAAPRSGCYGGAATFALPVCPPATQQAPPPPAAPGKESGTPTEPAAAVVLLVNHYRQRLGLAPVAVSAALTRSAGSWARSMTRLGMRHSGQPVAENVAAGQRSPAEVVRDWANSPGHARAMAGPYTEAGAGVEYDANGRAYWALQLR